MRMSQAVEGVLAACRADKWTEDEIARYRELLLKAGRFGTKTFNKEAYDAARALWRSVGVRQRSTGHFNSTMPSASVDPKPTITEVKP